MDELKEVAYWVCGTCGEKFTNEGNPNVAWGRASQHHRIEGHEIEGSFDEDGNIINSGLGRRGIAGFERRASKPGAKTVKKPNEGLLVARGRGFVLELDGPGLIAFHARHKSDGVDDFPPKANYGHIADMIMHDLAWCDAAWSMPWPKFRAWIDADPGPDKNNPTYPRWPQLAHVALIPQPTPQPTPQIKLNGDEGGNSTDETDDSERGRSIGTKFTERHGRKIRYKGAVQRGERQNAGGNDGDRSGEGAGRWFWQDEGLFGLDRYRQSSRGRKRSDAGDKQLSSDADEQPIVKEGEWEHGQHTDVASAHDADAAATTAATRDAVLSAVDGPTAADVRADFGAGESQVYGHSEPNE